MSSVSPRVHGLALAYLEDRPLLADPRPASEPWIDWPEFDAIVGEIAQRVAPRTLRDVGREIAESLVRGTRLRRASSGKGSLELFEHTALAILPNLFADLEANVERVDDGQLRIWLAFADGASEDRSEVFQVFAGMATALPVLVGQPEAIAELLVWPGGTRAIITVAAQASGRSAGFDVRPTVDHAGDGICECSAEGRVLFMSARAAERMGFPADYFVGRSIEELVGPEFRQPLLDLLLETQHSSESVRFSFRALDARGVSHDFEASATPFHRADGSRRVSLVLRAETTSTAQKQALAAELHDYRDRLEQGTEIVLETDANGDTTFVHDRTEAFDTLPRDRDYHRQLAQRADESTRHQLAAGADALLQGRVDRFAHSFRALDDDRRWRWLESESRRATRGTRRVVTTYIREATQQHEYEQALRAIAQSSYEGEGFLRSAVGHMAEALGVAHAIVSQPADAEPPSARTRAFWSDGELADDVTYPLAGTPCEGVFDSGPCVYAQDVQRRFPTDSMLSDMGIESYIGFPLLDYDGSVLGLVAALGERPIENVRLARSTMAIFGSRISAELRREKAAAAQRESELRLSALLEQSPDLVVEVEYGVGVRYVSPSVLTVLGYEPGEIDLSQLLLDGERERLAEAILAADARDEVVRVVTRARNVDGEVRWFDVSGRCYAVPDGNRRIVLTARDVTERRLETRTQEHLQLIMENSSTLMALCSLDGDLIFVNGAGRELLGLREDPSASIRAQAVVGDEVMEIVRSEALPALTEHGNWSGDVTLHHLETAEPIPVSASIVRLEDAATGHPNALAIICTDDRELRRTSQALEDSLLRLDLLSSSSYDLISEIDEEGRFLYASPNHASLMGHDPEEMIGRDALDFLVPDETNRALSVGGPAPDGTGSQIVTYQCLDAKGEARSFEASMNDYVTAAGEHRRFVVARDISERRAAEAALRESEEQLRQSQKLEAVGRLAGGIAHDFNNLLTAITGHSDLLIEDLGPDHASTADAYEILSASKRAAALTRQLLAFSRRQVLQPRVVDLNTLVSQIDRMLRRVIGEDFVLTCELEGGVWPVLADPGQLEQVLMNLVVNARDAMDRGGQITIGTANLHFDEPVSMHQGRAAAGDYVVLRVEDRGIGMDPETLARVFEPFFTTKTAGQGTGLGLSTVLGIVQQSEGFLRVHTQPEVGTRFEILLPRADDVVELPEAESPLVDWRGEATVLVVEDEDSVRSLVARHLRGHGYEVLEASDAEEALAHCDCHSGPIDLLLSDVVLRKIDGPSLADLIVARRSEVKVMYMSGFTDDRLEKHGVDRASVTLLMKPFARSTLLRSVSEALSRGEEEGN